MPRNISPVAVTKIRAQVADWTKDDATIAATLNNRTIANPTPAPPVPKPFSVSDLYGVLDHPAKAALDAHPSLPRILEDLNSNNITACNLWVTLLQEAGHVTATQGTAMSKIVNATQPDPDHPALISWAEQSLGRLVDADDINASRP